jgi:hypothetical protein
MFTKLIARTVNVQLAMKTPGKAGAFMHKLAARIWLEVTDMRVERLQAISEEDCESGRRFA